MFLTHPRVRVSIVGSLRDHEVACSASDRQGSNFESCVWRTVSSQSSHHPQEVLLAQFSLYVHKGGLKPDSFHLEAHIAEIYGDTLVSTLARRGRHQRDRLVTLRRGETRIFVLKNPRSIRRVRTRDACMTGESVR